MKLPSKYLYNLIVANLLWSFIPIIVKGLFSEISIMTIIFLRFFISGIFLFVIAVSLVLVNNYRNSEKKISLKGLFLNKIYIIRTFILSDFNCQNLISKLKKYELARSN